MQIRRFSDGSYALEIFANRKNIESIISTLSALKTAVDETIILASDDRIISKFRRIAQPGTSRLAWEGTTAVLVSLSDQDIDFIVHFLLQYLHTGCAPVSHIDVPLSSQSKNEYTLTVRAAEFFPGLSPEEAMKLIGDDSE